MPYEPPSACDASVPRTDLLRLNCRPDVNCDGKPWQKKHSSPTLTVFCSEAADTPVWRYKAVFEVCLRSRVRRRALGTWGRWWR